MTNTSEYDSIFSIFQKTLDTLFLRAKAARPRFAIAYSGGLDSSVLLHLTHRYASLQNLPMYAFHVHHGISQNADTWLTHCQNTCENLAISFDYQKIRLSQRKTHGLEAAAREERYRALVLLCQQHQIDFLLTAHHQNDQAETLLLHLLRGTGIAGLCAMKEITPTLFDQSQIQLIRPLLNITRQNLEDIAQQENLSFIEDESNHNIDYTRNALRNEVMPTIAKYFPDYLTRISTTTHHAQTASDILNERGEEDYQRIANQNGLDLTALKQLSHARQYNVLRYWLNLHQIRIRSTAWFNELCTQLFYAREDAQVCLPHQNKEIRRYQNMVCIIARAVKETNQAIHFNWTGESHIPFPTLGGTLYFEESKTGVDANWLQQQTLILRLRQGGEKIKLHPKRPNKDLKHHFQEQHIPAWERNRLPLITLPNQNIVYVTRLGMNVNNLSDTAPIKINLRWHQNEDFF
jgi:tRNA(Ile)-lysidine synthase